MIITKFIPCDQKQTSHMCLISLKIDILTIIFKETTVNLLAFMRYKIYILTDFLNCSLYILQHLTHFNNKLTNILVLTVHDGFFGLTGEKTLELNVLAWTDQTAQSSSTQKSTGPTDLL